MQISIRDISEHDLSGVITLMCEFAEYEKLSQYLEITEERLHTAMFGPRAFVEGLIVYDDANPVAYALFYPNFSSFRGERGLYLEDIYISDDYRGHKLGERILSQIARSARSRGLTRIDFLVLDWNTSAIGFYLKHGAERNDDERHFRFAGEAIDRLAS